MLWMILACYLHLGLGLFFVSLGLVLCCCFLGSFMLRVTVMMDEGEGDDVWNSHGMSKRAGVMEDKAG